MKCQNIKELLPAYLNDEVTTSERALIEAHLGGCDLCQRELALLGETQRRVRDFLEIRAAQAIPSVQAWDHLQTRLMMEPRSASQRIPLLWQWLASGHSSLKQLFEGGVTMKKSFALAILVVIILGLGMLTFVPTARAVTQGIINRLTGQVAQTTVITIEDGVVVRKVISTIERTQPLTLAEAQEQVDFTIQLPTYIPAGYAELRFEVTPPIKQVVTTFIIPRTAPGSDQRIKSFDLYQMKGRPGRFLGGEPVEELLVNGQTAILTRAETTIYNEADQPEPLVYYVLYWQEGEISFTLHSYFLSPTEMLTVAESLAPVQVSE